MAASTWFAPRWFARRWWPYRWFDMIVSGLGIRSRHRKAAWVARRFA